MWNHKIKIQYFTSLTVVFPAFDIWKSCQYLAKILQVLGRSSKKSKIFPRYSRIQDFPEILVRYSRCQTLGYFVNYSHSLQIHFPCSPFLVILCRVGCHQSDRLRHRIALPHSWQLSVRAHSHPLNECMTSFWRHYLMTFHDVIHSKHCFHMTKLAWNHISFLHLFFNNSASKTDYY